MENQSALARLLGLIQAPGEYADKLTANTLAQNPKLKQLLEGSPRLDPSGFSAPMAIGSISKIAPLLNSADEVTQAGLNISKEKSLPGFAEELLARNKDKLAKSRKYQEVMADPEGLVRTTKEMRAAGRPLSASQEELLDMAAQTPQRRQSFERLKELIRQSEPEILPNKITNTAQETGAYYNKPGILQEEEMVSNPLNMIRNRSKNLNELELIKAKKGIK